MSLKINQPLFRERTNRIGCWREHSIICIWRRAMSELPLESLRSIECQESGASILALGTTTITRKTSQQALSPDVIAQECVINVCMINQFFAYKPQNMTEWSFCSRCKTCPTTSKRARRVYSSVEQNVNVFTTISRHYIQTFIYTTIPSFLTWNGRHACAQALQK